MNWITLLQFIGILVCVLLGVMGYLLVVANARANQTEARVKAILRQASRPEDPHSLPFNRIARDGVRRFAPLCFAKPSENLLTFPSECSSTTTGFATATIAVVSLAVFSDGNRQCRPVSYADGRWGCRSFSVAPWSNLCL